ncbi:MAG: hypothetical protein Q6K80_10110 [Thermostichus sp. DG_1_6_bins_120]
MYQSLYQGIEELVQSIAAEVLKQLDPYLREQLRRWELSQPDPQLAEQAQALATERERNRLLQGQLDLMQLRQEKQHQQIRSYEAEIEQLYQEKQVLEQLIQELPEIYRRQVQARLQPIRERMAAIQAENHQLRMELHHLSYYLHHIDQMDSPKLPLPWLARPRRRDPLALPACGPEATAELPSYS